MAISGGAIITPRHLAVLGMVRMRFARDPTPEVIADELHFEIEEVKRLLGELVEAGYLSPPR